MPPIAFPFSVRLSRSGWWLSLSAVVALYFGLISLGYSLSQDYVVQDDARLHIVWLQTWIDAELFPDDLLARYYQAIQPVGFKLFYRLWAELGIAPMLFAKLLPTVLGLITTVYLFLLSLQLLPIPASAFLTTLILNQNIWLKDDLISSGPRAFVYPLFVAFLYYLLRRSLVPCLVAIALQGCFYPQLLLISIGVLTLRLFRWQGRSLKLTPDRRDYRLWLWGVGVAMVSLLAFSLTVSQEFGALATREQMRAMPEFGLNGRRAYFGVHPLQFMFGGASGLRLPLFPPIIWVSFSLPLLLATRLPLVRSVSREIVSLLQVILASLALFLLAHLLFPRLYLPSRYTFYSLRVVMAIATGIALTILLDAGWRWFRGLPSSQPHLKLKKILIAIGAASLALVVLVIPAIPAVFLSCQGWIVGSSPALYQFLAQQPKSSRVASLVEEANNIPAFAQRSVLVSPEYALPYHPLFYRQMQQRISDILQAQYSPDRATVTTLLHRHQINFFILARQFAEPDYLLRQTWLMQSSLRDRVLATVEQLQQGETPAIGSFIAGCSVFSAPDLIVLDAACIEEKTSE